MLLKRLFASKDGKAVIDVDITTPGVKNIFLFITLALGENGVGKSFFLKTIVDIFTYINGIVYDEREKKCEYDSFLVEYELSGNNYCLEKRENETDKISVSVNGINVVGYNCVKLPQSILAVSFMVDDKFMFRKHDKNDYRNKWRSKYYYLGVRTSKDASYTNSVENKISDYLKDILYLNGKEKKSWSEESGNRITIIMKILEYIGFDAKITIRIASPTIKHTNYNQVSVGKKKNFSHIDISSDTNIRWLINEYKKRKWPEEGKTRADGIKKKTNVNFIFYKKGKEVAYDYCSSGEKHILFALLGILSKLEEDSIVLIDEPEISLHPEWQIKYVSVIQSIFNGYKGCHFILASHSHYIVSDLPTGTSSIVMFKKADDTLSPHCELIPYDTFAWSAENIIYNVFGIRTSRNFYFEGDLSELISCLESFDGSKEKKDAIQQKIDKLQKYVYNASDPLYLILKDAEEKIK